MMCISAKCASQEWCGAIPKGISVYRRYRQERGQHHGHRTVSMAVWLTLSQLSCLQCEELARAQKERKKKSLRIMGGPR